jgi:DNA-binding NtrC family response regulator
MAEKDTALKSSLKDTVVHECAVLILQFYESKPEVPLNILLEDIEQEVLSHTLLEHAGCRAWAAKFLRMGRTLLMYRIKKFGKENFIPPSEHMKFLIKERQK